MHVEPGAGEDPRRRPRRGLWIRIGLGLLVVALVLAVAVTQLVAQDNSKTPSTDLARSVATTSTAPTTAATTTTLAPTTTTIPALGQPPAVPLPPVPGGVVRSGNDSPEIKIYEQRLAQLHFDPGPIDGHFDQKTRYAVEAVQKMMGWDRNGTIDQQFVNTISAFKYPAPLRPNGGADRVEINLDTQVLTLYKGYQVKLITTTSTGSGRKFCGGDDGCQYAITPAGNYKFQWHVKGWREGSLGRLYNPWYFNGGIAVHGYTSVPTYPASHGCARIPMHIAQYFGSLAYKDMPVFVVGTPAAPSGGPLPKNNPTSSTAPAPTQAPATPLPTAPPTAPHTVPPTPPPTKPVTTTTHATTTTTVAPKPPAPPGPPGP